MPSAALVDRLLRVLPDYGYEPSEVAAGRLAAYLELVVEAQARVRLLGSVEEDTLVRRHLGESLDLGQVVTLAAQRVVDIGSGAGFPGLALALAHEGLATTLVESNQKKASFLQSAVDRLGLGARIMVWPHYLERRPRAGTRAPVEGATLVTVRALEKMEDVPKWLGRWLDPGATAAFWVGGERARQWREQSREQAGGWRWGAFHRLPGAHTRGILLGSVPRETIGGAEPE